MLAMLIIGLAIGFFAGLKLGGEHALRQLAEGERQKMRRAAGLTKK